MGSNNEPLADNIDSFHLSACYVFLGFFPISENVVRRYLRTKTLAGFRPFTGHDKAQRATTSSGARILSEVRQGVCNVVFPRKDSKPCDCRPGDAEGYIRERIRLFQRSPCKLHVCKFEINLARYEINNIFKYRFIIILLLEYLIMLYSFQVLSCAKFVTLFPRG